MTPSFTTLSRSALLTGVVGCSLAAGEPPSGPDGRVRLPVVLEDVGTALPGRCSGGAIAPLGDLDGDGFDDFAIGAPECRDEVPDGAVHVFAGPLARDWTWEDDRATIVPRAGERQLGIRVRAAGDLDGDGSTELIVEARGVWAGGELRGRATLVVAGPLEGTVHSTEAVGRVGPLGPCSDERLVPLGDLDGDGFDDLALAGCVEGGYPANHVVTRRVTDPTAKQLGVAAAPDRFLARGTWYGSEPRVQPVSALDAAGRRGVAVGVATSFSNSDASEGFGNPGRVVIFEAPGGGDALPDDAAFAVEGDDENDHLGHSFVVGDLNGDGVDDLVAGAPGSDRGGRNAGAVFVFFGPLEGRWMASDADAILVGEAPGDHAGMSLDVAGDIDGDGFADLLIGAPGDRAPVPTEYDPPDDLVRSGGSWFVVPGPFEGDRDLADVTTRLVSVARPLGLVGRGAGDVDGDGRADLLLGSPDSVGRVWFVPGEGLP